MELGRIGDESELGRLSEFAESLQRHPETHVAYLGIEADGVAAGLSETTWQDVSAVAVSDGALIGWLVGDVLITPEEIRGLMENRLVTSSPPAGATRLTDWMAKHRDKLGVRYSSELARRRDRKSSYENLGSGVKR